VEISSDGYVTRWDDDSSVTRSRLTGEMNIWAVDGAREFTQPNGVSMVRNPDGTTTYSFPDGTLAVQSGTRGSIDFTFDVAENSQIATLSAGDHILTIEMTDGTLAVFKTKGTYQDGASSFWHKSGTVSITYADETEFAITSSGSLVSTQNGVTTTSYANGNLTVAKADGSSTTWEGISGDVIYYDTSSQEMFRVKRNIDITAPGDIRVIPYADTDIDALVRSIQAGGLQDYLSGESSGLPGAKLVLVKNQAASNVDLGNALGYTPAMGGNHSGLTELSIFTDWGDDAWGKQLYESAKDYRYIFWVDKANRIPMAFANEVSFTAMDITQDLKDLLAENPDRVIGVVPMVADYIASAVAQNMAFQMPWSNVSPQFASWVNGNLETLSVLTPNLATYIQNHLTGMKLPVNLTAEEQAMVADPETFAALLAIYRDIAEHYIDNLIVGKHIQFSTVPDPDGDGEIGAPGFNGPGYVTICGKGEVVGGKEQDYNTVSFTIDANREAAGYGIEEDEQEISLKYRSIIDLGWQENPNEWDKDRAYKFVKLDGTTTEPYYLDDLEELKTSAHAGYLWFQLLSIGGRWKKGITKQVMDIVELGP